MSKEIIGKHLNGNILISTENYIFDDVDYVGAKFTIKISGLFKNLCQPGKIRNTKGHTDEYRDRC